MHGMRVWIMPPFYGKLTDIVETRSHDIGSPCAPPHAL